MKAKPVKLIYGEGYFPCSIEEATHVKIHLVSYGPIFLPVMLKGKREGTGCWTWNGDTEKPTLRPSVLTTTNELRCHSWINDGQSQFLSDCNHEYANQTLDLLDVT